MCHKSLTSCSKNSTALLNSPFKTAAFLAYLSNLKCAIVIESDKFLLFFTILLILIYILCLWLAVPGPINDPTEGWTRMPSVGSFRGQEQPTRGREFMYIDHKRCASRVIPTPPKTLSYRFNICSPKMTMTSISKAHPIITS